MYKCYEVVCWPCCQSLFNQPGFNENSILINDVRGLEDFGSSAYFVEADWLEEISGPIDRDDCYVKVEWPDSQTIAELPEFEEHSYYSDDMIFFVEAQWLKDLKQVLLT